MMIQEHLSSISLDEMRPSLKTEIKSQWQEYMTHHRQKQEVKEKLVTVLIYNERAYLFSFMEYT